ncbi:M48 family metallopeptidase [Neisseria sp.]|uniref:M48 family metallopeptidase n=1 Tax=Neisseria sp. TaxID=192066 RepID=UPI0035A04F9C
MNFSYTLSDGQTVTVRLTRNARKNIILRPTEANGIHISVPPFLRDGQLRQWLAGHEHLLRQTLVRTPPPREDVRPETVWFRGTPHILQHHAATHIAVAAPHILLPEQSWPQQKQHLRRFLTAQAENILLPRLLQHAGRLNLHPAAVALSNAKTFWGVCRRSGIRLNWRLIGAPDAVIDYVCVHELCHIPHPDHSPRFWALVNRHTPHTAAAKAWLKRHGSGLFALD